MAIRIRRNGDGHLVALCAGQCMAQDGDVYLDDEIHYALSQKYWRDYDEINIVDQDDVARALRHECQD